MRTRRREPPAGAGEHDHWEQREKVAALSHAWANWLCSIPWQYFATLTFDLKKVFPVSEAVASKEAFWWCCQVSRISRQPLAWMYAVERGRGGCWHAHALLVGARNGLGVSPDAMWTERNGLIRIDSVNATRGALLYTTKSAALSGELVMSDTVALYRRSIASKGHVRLHPEDEESDAAGEPKRTGTKP